MRGPGVASSFGRFGDDASGEVEEVLVDLPEGAHLLFQLAHLDRQVLLVSHQVLRRKTRQESCRHPASALTAEAAPPSSSKSRTISSPPFFTSCSRAAPPPTPPADSRICPPPSPAWHSTPRARSAQKRTPKGSAPAGSASPTPEELSPFPSSSTSGRTSSRPSPGSSPRSPARIGQDGFRGPLPNSPRAGYPPQELSPSGDRHGQGTEQLWGSWQTGQGQVDVPMSLWLFTAQDSPVLPPDAPGLEPSPGGRAEPTARHRAGRTNDCTSQDCKGSARRENGFHCTGEQSSGRGQ